MPRDDGPVDDAFAATIAPPQVGAAFDATIAPASPPAPASPASRPPSQKTTNPVRSPVESDETLAAPTDATGELPPLPIIPSSHYVTGPEIARGGMGRIVSAEDRRLGRPVALKELLDPVADLGRFQREALITARLQHPGIVPVYEAGRWPSGEPFFAMKLVSGRPFDRVIADARTLQTRLALLPRMAAAADAMAYAHSQRVIHRDLKPGNVLIGDFGETVVIDWGLAKDLDAGDSPESAIRAPHVSAAKQANADASDTASSTLTIAGAVMGTPAYMA
ncbi:MAG: serine/threonine-protein kinase, partial [Proteobacteria bacterium]|nr:serine/threonine-protein kinase [Pseudomonadota bacterium]